ncbi:hypothetical protein J3458_003215 [Metarhizium acridum]|uniref:uncharacterized protein n=1 Tax=Metarhizium acridum TaxID=92637 RepID=UPI001C6C2740|nr:hypothetical protein J3458_003215 [Metarhizium acridum]
MVVDLGRRTGWRLKQGGMNRGNSSRKLQKWKQRQRDRKSAARSSKFLSLVLRTVVVSVLNRYAGQADFVAKLDKSLSQLECRVSVAASSHAIDVGMRCGEESQKQILLFHK